MLFSVVLALHIPSGIVAVMAGAAAATARKRPGRHPRAGRVYLWALTATAATAVALAAIRWPDDVHLLVLAVTAPTLGWYGYRARRRRRHGWLSRHAVAVGGSYIVLLTAFYVDNGPALPVWNRLPTVAFWLLPTAIGVPAIWFALHRRAARPQASTASRAASWRSRPGRGR